MSIPTTNLHITPSNVLSSGKISYKSGNPVIQFIIGEQGRGLLGQSLRFCGDFRLFKSSAEDINDGTLNMDPRLGAYSLIDQLVIKSQKTHAVIEHIRHYSRMMASLLPYTSNAQDGLGHMSQTAFTMPDFNLGKTGTTMLKSGKKTGNNFCMHLPCGLFNGTQAIPLDTTGGLLVEIHLSPDTQVIFNESGAIDANTTAFYELSNVFLCAEATEATSPPGPGTFEYNSVSSYFTSFNSTNAIVNFNLGLNNVLSVFGNLIPAQYINNLGHNGTATLYPVNSNGIPATITQAVFTRGGEKFPLEFNVDTIQKGDELNNDQQSVDAQLFMEGISAVRKFSNLSRTMVSPSNTFIPPTSSVANDGTELAKPDGGSMFILGMNYDAISNQGVSFATQNWGLNLTTNLTTDFPHAMFLYVHSKNTLVFDGQGGMQVMS